MMPVQPVGIMEHETSNKITSVPASVSFWYRNALVHKTVTKNDAYFTLSALETKRVKSNC